MERRTLLLELVAILTLLAMSEGVNNHMDVQDFVCRWEECKDRLVCGFSQLGTEALWINYQFNLILDGSETARCQQDVEKITDVKCIYEGLKLEKFGNNDSHKFQLFLLSFKEVKVRVEIKVFNLTLAQMNVPEKSVPCFRPQRPPEPLYNGFYHDSEKQELYFYWRPLDEVEFGSNHLWYTVYGSRGQMPTVVGTDFAIFSGWNPEQPAAVNIWSENIVGRSRNSSHLNVPILRNANRRQPLDVLYHDNRRIVEWNHTIEKDELEGYFIYSCRISSTNSSLCDINDRMISATVNRNRNIFQINSSMTRYHLAVSAIYTNGISGGLIWSKPAPPPSITGIMDQVVIIGSVMLICFAVYALSITIYKKLVRMADIQVELPYFGGTLSSRKETSSHKLSTISGDISPRASGMDKEKSGQEPQVPKENGNYVACSIGGTLSSGKETSSHKLSTISGDISPRASGMDRGKSGQEPQVPNEGANYVVCSGFSSSFDYNNINNNYSRNVSVDYRVDRNSGEEPQVPNEDGDYVVRFSNN